MADKPKPPRPKTIREVIADRRYVTSGTTESEYTRKGVSGRPTPLPVSPYAWGSGGTEQAAPGVRFDPATGEVVSTGGAQPPSALGAGASSINPTRPAPAPATGFKNQPSVNPADFGITPEMGRAMLAEGAAWMRDFTSGDAPEPPGWFEQQGTTPYTKEVGKAIDTGLQNAGHWLSGVFDVEDESDLHIAGVNVSAVESVWDTFWKGMFLTLDAAAMGGSAALLAANPHYWENRDTLRQATGPDGKPLFDRQGNPMMIGKTGDLWQDATQVSPGRALQALASPVQDVLGEVVTGEAQGVYSHNPEFDIADYQQREDWFSNDPQKIGSGLADASLGFVLDPTLVLGAAGKIARVRFLDGVVRGADDVAVRLTQMDDSVAVIDDARTLVDDAGNTTVRNVEDLLPEEVDRLNLSELSRLAYTATARTESAASKAVRASIEAIEDEAERAARLADFTPEYVKRADEPSIFNHHVLRDAPNRERISQALHRATTYEQAELIIRHALGDAEAARVLDSIAPELYRHVLDGERALIRKMVQSDPKLLSETVQRWEGVEKMLSKRVSELVEMRAADDVIAQHRAMLAEVQDTLDYARAAEVPPIGAGPKPSAEELDLASRAIDNQLRDNYLFQRALVDAEGDVSFRGSLLGGGGAKGRSATAQLFGGAESSVPWYKPSFGQSGKGVVDLRSGLKEGTLGYRGAAALERVIQTSRTKRAMEMADVQTAGSWGRAFGAGQRSIDFYGMDGEAIATIHSVPAMAAGMFPNLRAGARYLWVERPSGMIHTAGITAQESSREIRAVVNSVDMFHQPARQARNAGGELLYRTKSGSVTTDPSKGAPMMVGGVEAGEQVVQRYLDAFLLGSREGQEATRKFVDLFEEDMLQQVAWYHGIDVDQLRDVHYRINRRLQDIEKQVKNQKYWVEGNSPKKNYAPWLETHLQNSTFMKNWHEIEKSAHRLDLDLQARATDATIADKARWRAAATGDFLGNLFNEVNGGIQSVWRPLALARGGYTIRNVSEGLFRGTAYMFSLGPVWDATQQFELTLLNARRRAAAAIGEKIRPVRGASAILRAEDDLARAAKGAGFADMSPGFRKWLDNEVKVATTERNATQSILNAERRQLAENSAAYRGRRIKELDNNYAIIMDSRRQAQETLDRLDLEEQRLAARVTELEQRKADALASGKGWSVKSEERLKKAQDGLDAAALAERDRAAAIVELNTDRLVSMHDEMAYLRELQGGSTTLSSTDIGLIDTLDWLEQVDLPYREMQLLALSDPSMAATVRHGQTMALRRIYGENPRHLTDTDTLATMMKRRALADPFNPDDPYTSIITQALSADETVRQTAAMRMQAVTGGMAAYETRYYTKVMPGDPEYFDGVATAANQVMNSDIGRIVIAGRAEGLGDDEIVSNIVRFLYSPEGQSSAAFINAANDLAFRHGGRFDGLTAQAQREMLAQVRANQPLYIALDEAQDEFRSAMGTALSARNRMPKARFAGDSPNIPKRAWSGDTFGDYTVSSSGRGKWQVTYPDGTVEDLTSKSAARSRARALQTADDDVTRAHWTPAKPVTAGGRTFANEAEIDEFLAAAQAKRDAAQAALDKAEAAPLKIKGTGARQNTGPVLTPETIRQKAAQGDADMVDAIEYASETLRRYDTITNGNENLQRYLASIEQLPIGGRHKPDEAGNIIRGFLTDADGNDLPGLQPVIGNTAQWVGTNDIAAWWHKKTMTLFKYIGSLPEDTFVRSPFYGRVFNREAQRMTDVIADQQGGFLSIRDVNNIRDISHRRALKETKQWLYTIDRRTTFGQATEKFIPFSSAMQNSATAVGRLLWQDPKTIWLMTEFWHAPDKLGWTTENDMFLMPIDWVPKNIRDAFGLGETAQFSKKSFDVSLNLSAGAPPLIAIAASEYVKSQFFSGDEVPWWLEALPGDTGEQIWEGLKFYAIGDFGASPEFASWDRAAAPWLGRLVKGIGGLMGDSKAFGDTYALVAMNDAIEAEQEGRDPAAPEELAARANLMTITRAMGQLVVLPAVPKYPRAGDVPMNEAQQIKFNAVMSSAPADLREQEGVTGYESLTTIGDAIRANDKLWYADKARIAMAKARQASGEMVPPEELMPRVAPSEKLFGAAVWRAYKLASLDNVAGLPATDRAEQFARDNEQMLSQIAPNLEDHQMLEQIGMFAYDPNTLYTAEPYDANAQAYFVANQIPGTNEEYKQIEDIAAMELSASVAGGWQTYMRGLDALELDAMRNGVKPPFRPSNDPNMQYYYKEKQALEAYVGSEFEGWDASKRSRDDRAALTTETIEIALRDETFQKNMAANPVWRKGGVADIYVSERRRVMAAMDAIKADAEANGIASLNASSPKHAPWIDLRNQAMQRWALMQVKLKQMSPSWSAIQDRYIGDDLEPWKSTMTEYGLEEEAS